MKWTDDIGRKVASNIIQVGQGLVCPLCRRSSWIVSQGFVSLLVEPDPEVYRGAGRRLPCVAITCDTCGNTLLINLLQHGFKESDFEN